MESDRAVISINVSVSRQSGSLMHVWPGALSGRGELSKYLMFHEYPCKSPSLWHKCSGNDRHSEELAFTSQKVEEQTQSRGGGPKCLLFSPAPCDHSDHTASSSLKQPGTKTGAGSWAAVQWTIQITRADEFWGWADVKGGRQAEQVSFKYTKGYLHKVADQLFSISRKQDGGSVCGGAGRLKLQIADLGQL